MTLRIFIGYDSREAVAYHVLAHSIMRRSSVPVAIEPVMLSQMRGLYTRERGSMESTEFSMSRFMVPYLAGYAGWVVFMDCDMLCLGDIAELVGYATTQTDKAVLVCKHEYVPKGSTKFLDQPQTSYPRKNWSSLMVMSAARCRALTPAFVHAATGLELHRFAWLQDHEIGELPLEWNWLVGEYQPNPAVRMLHYTLGGPWFPASQHCDHADLWREELHHLVGRDVLR